MPSKTPILNTEDLAEGLNLLESIIYKNDTTPTNVQEMRARIVKEKGILPLLLADAAGDEEIKYNIIKNTFTITTRYFFDNYFDDEVNRNIFNIVNYTISFESLISALQRLPSSQLNTSHFSEQIITLIKFCFELCPINIREKLGVLQEEQLYGFLRPIAQSEQLEPSRLAVFTDQKKPIYPFSNSDVYTGFVFLGIDQRSSLDRLLSYEPIDQYSLNYGYCETQDIIDEMGVVDDHKTLLAYQTSLRNVFYEMELTGFHRQNPPLGQTIQASFRALGEYFKEQNFKNIICQFFREGNYKSFVRFVSLISICKDYEPQLDDINTLMSVLDFARIFFPEAQDNNTLAAYIQHYLYRYQLTHRHFDSETYQKNIHVDLVLKEYFLILTSLSYTSEFFFDESPSNRHDAFFRQEKPSEMHPELRFTAIEMVSNIAHNLLIACLRNSPSNRLYERIHNYIDIMVTAAGQYGCKIDKKADMFDMLFHIILENERHFQSSINEYSLFSDKAQTFRNDALTRRQQIQSSQLLRLLEKTITERKDIQLKVFKLIVEKIASRLIMPDLNKSQFYSYYEATRSCLLNAHMQDKQYSLFIQQLFAICVEPMLRFKLFNQLGTCLDLLKMKNQALHEPEAGENTYPAFIDTAQLIIRIIEWVESGPLEKWKTFGPVSSRPVQNKKLAMQVRLSRKSGLKQFEEDFNTFYRKSIGALPVMTFPDQIIATSLKKKLVSYIAILAELSFGKNNRISIFLSNMTQLLEGKAVDAFAAAANSGIKDTASSGGCVNGKSVDDPVKKITAKQSIPFEQVINQFFGDENIIRSRETKRSRKVFTDKLGIYFLSLKDTQRRPAIDQILTLMFKLVDKKDNADLLKSILAFIENTPKSPIKNYYSLYMKHLILKIKVGEKDKAKGKKDKANYKQELLKRHYDHSALCEPQYLANIPINKFPETMKIDELELKYRDMINEIVDAEDARIQSEKARETARVAAEAQAKAQQEALEKATREAKAAKRRADEQRRCQEQKEKAEAKAEAKALIEAAQDRFSTKPLKLTEKTHSPHDPRFFKADQSPPKTEVYLPLPAEITDVFERLEPSIKESLYLVGGAVRDLLLKRLDPSDYDFVYTGDISTLKEKLHEAEILFSNAGSAEHPLVKLKLKDRAFDIEISCIQKPEWEENARQRDLTINALYVKLWGECSGIVADPLKKGLEDLSNRQLRFTGEVESMIKGDPTKLLRLFKLMSRLGDFKLDRPLGEYLEAKQFSSHVSAFICSCKSQFNVASKSRLRNALLKQVLSQPNAKDILTMMEANKVSPLLLQAPIFDCHYADYASLDPEKVSHLEDHERFCYFFIEYILDLKQSSLDYDYIQTITDCFWFPWEEQELFYTVIPKLIKNEQNTIEYVRYAETFPNLETFVSKYSEKYAQKAIQRC